MEHKSKRQLFKLTVTQERGKDTETRRKSKEHKENAS
jgi:hypothetical protein